MFGIDRRHRLAVAVCALLLGVCNRLPAQVPGVPSPGASASPASDSLGRDSPFGTITGFSTAVHRSDFATAVRYLQADGRSLQEVENLANGLSDLLDRYFTQGAHAKTRHEPVTPHGA